MARGELILTLTAITDSCDGGTLKVSHGAVVGDSYSFAIDEKTDILP